MPVKFCSQPCFLGLMFFNEPEMSEQGLTGAQKFFVLKIPRTKPGFIHGPLLSRRAFNPDLNKTILLDSLHYARTCSTKQYYQIHFTMQELVQQNNIIRFTSLCKNVFNKTILLDSLHYARTCSTCLSYKKKLTYYSARSKWIKQQNCNNNIILLYYINNIMMKFIKRKLELCCESSCDQLHE